MELDVQIKTVAQGLYSESEYKAVLYEDHYAKALGMDIYPNNNACGFYTYPDEPEENFGMCLKVNFRGCGMNDYIFKSNRDMCPFDMHVDRVAYDATVTLSKVFVQWKNVKGIRCIGVRSASLDRLVEKSIIIKIKGRSEYILNTPMTLEHYKDVELEEGENTLHPEFGIYVNISKLVEELKLEEGRKDLKWFTGPNNGAYGYHWKARRNLSGLSEVKVGVEIEKISVLNTIIDREKLFDRYALVKEHDSSLGELGVEYVTPVLPFDKPSETFKYLKKVSKIIDIPFDNDRERQKAGGHINISIAGKTSYELLEHFKVYAPLFYAIYLNRAIKNGYSTAKSLADSKRMDSHNAFNPRSSGNVLELRIFPAIDTYENLKDRLNFVHYCIKKGYKRFSTVIEALANDNSRLRKLVAKLAPDLTTAELLKRYYAFTKLDQAKMTEGAISTLKKFGVIVDDPKFTYEEWQEKAKELTDIKTYHREVVLTLRAQEGAICV